MWNRIGWLLLAVPLFIAFSSVEFNPFWHFIGYLLFAFAVFIWMRMFENKKG